MLICLGRSRTNLIKHAARRCAFSTAASLRARQETVTVPIQSNGSITLNIYDALATEATQEIGRAVVVYLPRGPVLHNPADDESNVAILASSIKARIARINYRFSKEHQFPTPLHDVLAGYDWIVSNLLPRRSIVRTGRSEHIGRLAVCGELLGGSLATSVALTECHIGEPGVGAAAVNNPITDWTDIESSSRGSKGETGLPTELMPHFLAKQRDILFRKPEHYFDSFASPILFFRSAGIDVPIMPEEKPLDELSELAQLERQEYLGRQDHFFDFTNPETSEDDPGASTKRKASRRYPSNSLALRLPSMRISNNVHSPLSRGAQELVSQLRSSYQRQVKARLLRSVDPTGQDWSVDDMLDHEQYPGTALWDDSEAGKIRMRQAAAWLAQKLHA